MSPTHRDRQPQPCKETAHPASTEDLGPVSPISRENCPPSLDRGPGTGLTDFSWRGGRSSHTKNVTANWFLQSACFQLGLQLRKSGFLSNPLLTEIINFTLTSHEGHRSCKISMGPLGGYHQWATLTHCRREQNSLAKSYLWVMTLYLGKQPQETYIAFQRGFNYPQHTIYSSWRWTTTIDSFWRKRNHDFPDDV